MSGGLYLLLAPRFEHPIPLIAVVMIAAVRQHAMGACRPPSELVRHQTRSRHSTHHFADERGDLSRAALGLLDVEHVSSALEDDEPRAANPGKERLLIGA